MSPRPAPLVVACVLTLLESVVVGAMGVAFLVDLVRGRTVIPAATVFLVVFCAGVATLLVLAARALWNGRRWARSPVMTWQVLLVVLSVGWLQVEMTPWALAVLAVAVVLGVLLLLPQVVAATSQTRPPADEAPAGR
ncbi:hypothetical protein [Cellulomonas fimi]|uniref:Integral membrane protein n=1 Tax=Cellulomonas fimi (strain ATCC 484 / DSM 20113 / JCM 1341 / CCUG 24087 / LMG 16345 / NBRC 15513 / NCIMB 8980 / NCTC 7547 / NRS-133) TaxID=590998 RepID=F4H552_CELFA|nr:hypothetical protein [Cellulomonas fimi]AEE46658.1 hypothetical protein Celf_2533 [Cellulomonas fimi ATCC 484]NNH08598.1 hypothetical protein [Cellulomonas fimi]